MRDHENSVLVTNLILTHVHKYIFKQGIEVDGFYKHEF